MKSLVKTIFSKQQQKKEADYAAVYLRKNDLKGRQPVYVSTDVHVIVSQLVQMFPDKKVTISGYIDNVLMKHFEEHKQEINELYKTELSKKDAKRLF